MRRIRGSWPIFTLLMSVMLAAGMLPAQVTVHYINVGQAASALVEFQEGAILIDAGGEDTSENPSGAAYREHLLGYIKDVLQQHPGWNNTIEGVIVSHPHKDHTMFLMDVMQTFNVRALIDNGDAYTHSTGFPDVQKARAFAQAHKIHYIAAGDSSIHGTGYPVHLIDGAGPGMPQIALLSSRRDCSNANNDSLGVRISAGQASLLFVGDSENESSKCTAELSLLGSRYGQTSVLHANVLHVAHHGSPNGSTADFLKLVSPDISVISAGDPDRRGPGRFHAFEYGHPRQEAMGYIVANTQGTRESKDVTIFEASNVNASVSPPKTIPMTKAVYCTCWDGDIKIAYDGSGAAPTITTTGFRPPVPAKDRASKPAVKTNGKK